MKSSEVSRVEIGLRFTLIVVGVVLAAATALLVAENMKDVSEGETSTTTESSRSAAELAYEALHAIPGSIVDKSIEIAGKNRNFIVHLPSAYTPAMTWPVIFAFHAYGEDADEMQRLSHLERSAAIVIYPNGFNESWEGAPYAAVGPTDDREFVRAILSDLHQNYSVDDARIYATGLSNGGGFAARLACTMPEVFAAVATVSAANYDNNIANCTPQPVPMLMIHGEKDDIILYDGGQRHGARYWSVADYGDFFSRRNQCQPDPQVYEDDIAVRTQWSGCAKDVIQIKVKGKMHEWFATVGSPGNEQNEYATTEVLRFFGL